ncbi:MAG TPA: fibronectin type III domain-containing protein [Phycisphaerae bacterium]|nr:fibronectin type III domain-containing protein [Phycisphaerae bacterium]
MRPLSQRSPFIMGVLLAATAGLCADRAAADGTGPTIAVWYGPVQSFGAPGLAQRWVNVLGNVSDPDGILDITFALNDGAEQPLAIGPDRRRLLEPGDFNVEIDYADLQPGANDVRITARDGAYNPSVAHVQVNFNAGGLWPLPWTIDWTAVGNIQSVAQVIDGDWSVTPQGLHPDVMGYDRVIGIGDLTWVDYELTATITLNALDPAGYNWPSVSPGFGVTTRWGGHTDNPVRCPQPHCGWLPSGGGFWYDAGYDGPLAIFGDEVLYALRNQTLTYGVPYRFRLRVETQPDSRTFYALNVWPDGSAEPGGWQLSGYEPPAGTVSGSVILVAHHVDISIRSLSVTPLSAPPASPPQISSVQVSPQTEGATISWVTNEPTTGAVAYGLSAAYSGGSVTSGANGQNHAVQLTSLSAATTYHFQIRVTDADGETAQTTDATFNTLAAADTTPPVISGVQATAGAASAVISWTTNEPATSRVEYGLSGGYGGEVADAALATNHQMTLTGLAADTLYHYRVHSTDDAGNAATSTDRTFTTAAAPASALVSDAFEGSALDTGLWTFVNPLGDADVTMTGTQVSLDIPVTDADHEIWYDANTAPRILQAVDDFDFEFEVKFDSPLTEDLQIQGVAVEETDRDVVRAEFHHLGGVTRIYVASIFDGGYRTHRHQIVPLSAPMYLRVVRAGDQFTVSYSTDGTNFTTAAAFNQPMTVYAVGIHIGASAGVAHSAVADYFLDLSTPVTPPPPPPPPPPGEDCNENGVDDADEIASGAVDDCNATGIPDVCELAGDDCDANGVPDECDPDGDGDGAIDACDGCPADGAKTSAGICGCGESDADADGDGVADCIDNCPQTANAEQADCDGDGTGDACAGGADCNANGVPDACDIAVGQSADADGDSIPDECAPAATGIFEAGTAPADGTYRRVSFAQRYVAPVVVCTINYSANDLPVVPRVRNVTADGFDVRLQNPAG